METLKKLERKHQEKIKKTHGEQKEKSDERERERQRQRHIQHYQHAKQNIIN